jgi:hypothetical protein
VKTIGSSLYVLLCVIGCGWIACHQSPAPVTPQPDADAASPESCEAMCSNLASLACEEGVRSNCVERCHVIVDSRIPPLDVACAAKAKDKAAARGCEGITCP